MILKKIKNEEGFWSVFVIIILLTLVLLGMGAHMMMRSESANIAEQMYSMQAEYAANAAAYHGIRRLQLGALDESTVLQVGDADVTLDTTLITGTTDILLTIQATLENAQKTVEVEISNPGRLQDKSIYTIGNVFNVSGRDSTGTLDPTRVVTNADSVPSINTDSLRAMAAAQGHVETAAAFSAPDDYPDTDFYRPDGVTPNVTHIQGDLTVGGGRDLYGIFVIDGDATIHGNARIYGVVFLPNPTSTIITGGGTPSESTINGGIVSHGNITGTGNHITAWHVPEFMRVFCSFMLYPGSLQFDVLSWTYL